MLSLSYLVVLTNALSFIAPCTPFEDQWPVAMADVASKSSIPGGSTFEFCAESDPDNDIFTIGSFFVAHLPTSNH